MAEVVRVVFDGPALHRLAVSAAQAGLTVKANRVLNAARRNAPVDEGRLRASLTVEYEKVGNAMVAKIGSNLDYALFVHEGTGIYGPKGTPIRPTSGQWLRWPVKNNSGNGARRRYRSGATAQWAFAREVKGVRGRPFLRDALNAAR